MSEFFVDLVENREDATMQASDCYCYGCYSSCHRCDCNCDSCYSCHSEPCGSNCYC